MSQWLTRLVGPARAMEIITLGAVDDAEVAPADGLVTEVAAAEVIGSSDFREGLAAAHEKCQPIFEGN